MSSRGNVCLLSARALSLALDIVSRLYETRFRLDKQWLSTLVLCLFNFRAVFARNDPVLVLTPVVGS